MLILGERGSAHWSASLIALRPSTPCASFELRTNLVPPSDLAGEDCFDECIELLREPTIEESLELEFDWPKLSSSSPWCIRCFISIQSLQLLSRLSTVSNGWAAWFKTSAVLESVSLESVELMLKFLGVGGHNRACGVWYPKAQWLRFGLGIDNQLPKPADPQYVHAATHFLVLRLGLKKPTMNRYGACRGTWEFVKPP